MPYLSRSAWGAAPPVKTVPVSKHLKGVCLHYMGFPVRTEDPIRLVKSIQRNHMAEPKNWWDIAYNELIAQDGTVLEGRGLLHRSGAQVAAPFRRPTPELCCSGVDRPCHRQATKCKDRAKRRVTRATAADTQRPRRNRRRCRTSNWSRPLVAARTDGGTFLHMNLLPNISESRGSPATKV